MTSRVVIVGGGITGLAAAHYLRRADPDAGRLSIKVLERRGHLGGSIRTTRRDGFLLEAGADSFLTTTPWAVGLAAGHGRIPP
ncbi:MAG: FAD-dependent oxidoreductase, partial [Candidatus Thermoplasmatota archaeon]